MKTFEEQMEYNNTRSPESKARLFEYYHIVDVMSEATDFDSLFLNDHDPEKLKRRDEFIKYARLWLRELEGITEEEQYQKAIQESIALGDGTNEAEVLLCALFG